MAYGLRTIKVALNILLVTQKYAKNIAVVYGNWMAAEYRLLSFVFIKSFLYSFVLAVIVK